MRGDLSGLKHEILERHMLSFKILLDAEKMFILPEEDNFFFWEGERKLDQESSIYFFVRVAQTLGFANKKQLITLSTHFPACEEKCWLSCSKRMLKLVFFPSESVPLVRRN